MSVWSRFRHNLYLLKAFRKVIEIEESRCLESLDSKSMYAHIYHTRTFLNVVEAYEKLREKTWGFLSLIF